jgi:H+/gluconate symporter-like permease
MMIMMMIMMTMTFFKQKKSLQSKKNKQTKTKTIFKQNFLGLLLLLSLLCFVFLTKTTLDSQRRWPISTFLLSFLAAFARRARQWIALLLQLLLTITIIKNNQKQFNKYFLKNLLIIIIIVVVVIGFLRIRRR